MPGTRWLFAFFGGATLLAVSQLYIFPSETDRFFAWTIDLPLSASFIGAGFGAGFVLSARVRRRTDWVGVRLSFISVFVFTLIMLAATLIHLDRFHLSTGGFAEFVAWVWVTVYLVVPIAMAGLLLRQPRGPAGDRAIGLPLSPGLRLALVIEGVGMMAIGLFLFVAPVQISELWPWPLTPLVSRAMAALVTTLGLAALLALREDDMANLQAPAVAYVVFSVLTLGALMRFSDGIEWMRPSIWVLIGWIMVVLVTGIYGAIAARSGPNTG